MIERLAQLHEDERLVRAAQTPAARCAIWLLASALLLPRHKLSLIAIAAIGLVTWMPERRRVILSLAAAVFGLNAMRRALGPELHLRTPALWPIAPADWLAPVAATGAVIAFLYLCYLAAAHFARLPGLVKRFPQVALHAAIWAALALIWQFPGHAALIAISTTLAMMVWRIGFMVLSGKRAKAARTRFRDHLFYLWPVFAIGPVPFGKGHDYLSSHECRDRAAFARAQLAGLKLLVLANAWAAVLWAMKRFVWGDAAIPELTRIVAGTASASLPVAWAALYLDLVQLALQIAVPGHLFVGCLRLFGFSVFRNTYKPFLARSIVDFWGRYDYYFKELLVEFFFYPCYLRHFKARPQLRLFAAAFAAACLGNLYMHVLSYRQLDEVGPLATLALIWPRTVYCLLLALGIYVSMRRQQVSRAAAAPAPSPLVRLRQMAGVWTFFALIHIWNVRPYGITFGQRNAFLLRLFGG
jgi:hypothetical protein